MAGPEHGPPCIRPLNIRLGRICTLLIGWGRHGLRSMAARSLSSQGQQVAQGVPHNTHQTWALTGCAATRALSTSSR